MAMIKCPECGAEISDKAKKCIHCGKVFVEEIIKKELKCPECGAILSEDNEICPNCGCPIEKDSVDNEIKPQQVEVSSIKMGKKTKGIITAIIVALLICMFGMLGGIGYKIYSDKKAEQEYEETYKETYNTYIDNLEKVQVLMISGGSDAESLCNLTLRVWGNAIYEDKDDETDKYTRDGALWNDFNTALANLYSDPSTTTKVSNIESNQASVKNIIKKLQNPPEGLDRCYDTVTELYEAYKTLTDLATNPTGNYTGYASNKSNAVSDFMSAYETLDNQIPEKLKNE